MENAKKAGKERRAAATETLDPYNNTLVMPLDEFIQHSAAREALHNGAAFQVRSRALGLYFKALRTPQRGEGLHVHGPGRSWSLAAISAKEGICIAA